ncbi:CpaF family protein [Thalassoroseus pseudoceratinae]|uniref:CpaF family protein n=1 Tax=Thalassoroseus pseudoceratinae TaxID=2713176 RepID=UPI00141DAA0B|nr:CpaF family protein [Thalassoroseus pseudoceratinae]
MRQTPTMMLSDQEKSQARFQQLKVEIHRNLISGMDLTNIEQLDDYTLRNQLRRGLEKLCDARAELISQAERSRLVNEIIDETLGLGPIDPLLRDPTLSDILINGPNAVYVERNGRLEQTNVKFHDNQHLVEITQRIANRMGRRLDESSPMVDARMADGSRVNAVIQPLALDGALVSIRRFNADNMGVDELVRLGTVTRPIMNFLAACVKSRLNLIISGGTGSGKTTMLNLLSQFIDSSERIATIEDAAELRLRQPHVARMETRPPNSENRGAITARDLVRNSLRMRPDRIIVGECRGEEAFDMLQAMTSGHDGSMTTVHANNANDALSRLEMLIGMAGYDLPVWFINRQIASAVNIVVHCARISGGVRKVTQVLEVVGVKDGQVKSNELFRYDQEGVDQTGNAVGRFRCMCAQPACLSTMQARGINPPRLTDD